jgi:2-polyprenyl-6-methoxyphenol hydroxylase-like FAD-dependent oxidoreductase
MTCQLAEQFSKGKIFLAGDAAHSFPPLGSLGLNAGIQDVHNLIHKFNILKHNTEMQRNREVIQKELLRYG